MREGDFGSEGQHNTSLRNILAYNPLLSPEIIKDTFDIISLQQRNSLYHNPPSIRGSTVRLAVYGPPPNRYYWGIPFLARNIGPGSGSPTMERLSWGPDVDVILPYSGDDCPSLTDIISLPKPTSFVERYELGVLDEYSRMFSGSRSIFSINKVNTGTPLVYPGIQITSYLITDQKTHSPTMKIDFIQQRSMRNPRPNPHQLRTYGTAGLSLDDTSQAGLIFGHHDIFMKVDNKSKPFPNEIILYRYGKPASQGKEVYFYLRGFAQLAAYNTYPRNTQGIKQELSPYRKGNALVFESEKERKRITPFLVQESLLGMLLDPNGFVNYLNEVGLIYLFPMSDPKFCQEGLTMVGALHTLMKVDKKILPEEQQIARTYMTRLVELLTPQAISSHR